LYHTDAREYHCTLGRFVQVDPVGLAAGPNVYAYCGASPADTVDPSGLLDLEKVERGVAGIFEGYVEFLSASSTAFPNAMTAKGYGDFLLGINKTVEGLRDVPGLGAPGSIFEGLGDLASLLLTGRRSQLACDVANVSDMVLTTAALTTRPVPRNLGANTYNVDYRPLPGRSPERGIVNNSAAGQIGVVADRASADEAVEAGPRP